MIKISKDPKNQYLSLIKFYLICNFLLSAFFLCALNQSLNNAIFEWIINYQGGFVRRGLTGELFYEISKNFNLNLRLVILIFEILFYFIYFTLLFKFIKNIKFKPIDLIIFFSPIFLFFPLSEFEALGRKELLIFIFAFIFFFNLKNFKKNNNIYVIIFILLPFLILICEATVFYLGFFLIVFILKKKFNLKDIFKLIISLTPSIIVSLLIIFNPQSVQNNEKMCDALLKLNQSCGLASDFITHDIRYHMKEVYWSVNDFVKYFFVFIISFLPILFLASCYQFNKKIINLYIAKIPFIYLFILIISSSLIMYFIAVDTARWTVITYTLAFILFYSLIKFNFLILRNNNKLIAINNFFARNKKILILFILIYGFSWNLKPVMHENIGTFPLYRLISKLTKSHWYNWNLKLNY